MFWMSFPFAIILAVIAIAAIHVIIQNWSGSSLECFLMAMGACFLLTIVLIRFGTGGGKSSKMGVNFEPMTSAISDFFIEIDLKCDSRLAPNFIKSILPCTNGISWCGLYLPLDREGTRS